MSKGCSSSVHGLILAGGEGSRLAAGGIRVPKPLVEVAGRPQIVGLLETFAALGCGSLTCAVRADFPAVTRVLDGRRFGPPLTLVECRTPSSLHTLVEGLRAVPPGPVFCSMVDTVMRPADWRAVYRATARHLEEGADMVLAVTPYVDDESPVYVIRGGDDEVRAVRDEPVPPPCVTGGVYGFGHQIFSTPTRGSARAKPSHRTRGATSSWAHWSRFTAAPRTRRCSIA